ncbi:MAG: iron ABC transporter permease [Candidatus Methanomethylophilaceae archaeon]
MDDCEEPSCWTRFIELLKGTRMDDTARGKYEGGRRRKVFAILLLTVLTAVVSVAVLGIGAVIVPFTDVVRVIFHPILPQMCQEPTFSYYTDIIVDYRAPRILLAILTGACLGVAGASMQGILRNPLADPFTLGLSSAASCGAGIALVLGPVVLGSAYNMVISIWGTTITMNWIFMAVMAFLMGLSSVVIIIMMTGRRSVSRSTLILTGVVIGYLFSAVLSYLKYISDEAVLKDITMWLLGGMWGASWSAIIIVLPVAVIGIAILESYAVDMNTLSIGDDVAKNLGVDVRKLRIKILILSALITSVCIAFTGIIGFVGLMAPHIVRILVGNDHRYLIPLSAMLGALILVSCDALARIIVAPNDLPVGIIMYVIGGLFFMFLVRKMRGGYDI